MSEEEGLTMEHTSNEKIGEALKLLDEAAKQKKEELMTLMSDKYAHLKNVIVETEGNIGRTLSDARKHAVETVTHAKDVGVEKVREVAGDVDKHVHANPWQYIAGTAAVGLLLGYVLGRNRK
jgi:ElaB/YqjD/DUF883 family membrane-anchored ribosome-binding protein